MQVSTKNIVGRYRNGERDFSEADLTGADLIGANLSGADLTGACLIDFDLIGANLSGADLTGACLIGADLTGANLSGANLSGANLSGADLTGACLIGVDLTGAYLASANLSGAKLDLEIQPGLLLRIAQMILANPQKLNMDKWESECGSTACLSGWAVQLSRKGKKLQEVYGFPIAGLKLLGTEAHSHFYDTNEDAIAYLQSVLDESKN